MKLENKSDEQLLKPIKKIANELLERAEAPGLDDPDVVVQGGGIKPPDKPK